MQDALVVVDVQEDFCTGGALAAHDTDSLIVVINDLIAGYSAAGRLVIFTRDWHPADHCSFRDQGGQWPPHCIQETPGARFHPGLIIPGCHLLVSKATEAAAEAYSGFQGTGLDVLLNNLKVSSLEVCGIATEYCVRSTAGDAARLGFEVEVPVQAIRPVAPGSPEEKQALESLEKLGVRLT